MRKIFTAIMAFMLASPCLWAVSLPQSAYSGSVDDYAYTASAGMYNDAYSATGMEDSWLVGNQEPDFGITLYSEGMECANAAIGYTTLDAYQYIVNEADGFWDYLGIFLQEIFVWNLRCENTCDRAECEAWKAELRDFIDNGLPDDPTPPLPSSASTDYAFLTMLLAGFAVAAKRKRLFCREQ